MKASSKQKSALSHRIAKYGAGAGSALVAGFAAAPQAKAAVDYYDPADLTIGTAGGAIYFDLDNSAGGTLASTTFFAGWDFYLTFYFTEAPAIDREGYAAILSSAGFAARLASGATIGAGPSFSGRQYLEYYNSGPWNGGGEGYLGLRLGAGPTFNYGWARINYNDAGTQITLLDFAIERTADTSIAAGAIPEPGHGLLALAAGAAGLAAWRRRKRS